MNHRPSLISGGIRYWHSTGHYWAVALAQDEIQSDNLVFFEPEDLKLLECLPATILGETYIEELQKQNQIIQEFIKLQNLDPIVF